MITLDEAIIHAEKIAEEQAELHECHIQHGEQGDYVNECLKCAVEHRQLAEWLKDYKRLLEQAPCEDAELDFVQPHKKIPVNLEPCEDVVSRQAMNECIETYCGSAVKLAIELRKLPSVNPQPKTGKWIMIDKELQRYKCSECGEVIRLYKKSEIPKLEKDETLSNYPFSHCGCRMIEPRERSDKG